MSMPGFVSESGALYPSFAGSRVIPAIPMGGGTPGGCLVDCVADCADLTGTAKTACVKKCRAYCTPPPETTGPGSGPINYTNCDLCKAGNIAWYAACVADTSLLGGNFLIDTFGKAAAAVLSPVVGALISLGLGASACKYVYDQSIKQCPC